MFWTAYSVPLSTATGRDEKFMRFCFPEGSRFAGDITRVPIRLIRERNDDSNTITIAIRPGFDLTVYDPIAERYMTIDGETLIRELNGIS